MTKRYSLACVPSSTSVEATGYRRVARLLNREADRDGRPHANHKRVYRVMRKHGLLLQRYTGKSTRTHDGVIITLKSILRWYSDSFEIRCWNGERIQVAFSLDCCDRGAMRYVATTGAITGEMIRDLIAETLVAIRADAPSYWLALGSSMSSAGSSMAISRRHEGGEVSGHRLALAKSARRIAVENGSSSGRRHGR